MPIYEYKCLKQGHVFEALQKSTEGPLEACEVCGSPVERLISNTSFQLKGSGWYVTDFKNSGTKASAPKEEVKASESKAADTDEKKGPSSCGTPQCGPSGCGET